MKYIYDKTEKQENSYLGYFDYAASAPPFEESLMVYQTISSKYFSNPSSAHYTGMKAKEEFEKSKDKMKGIIGAPGDCSVIVTSGGSESNNLVVNSFIQKYPNKKILLAIDNHASTWFAKKKYDKQVDVLKINKNGLIDIDRLKGQLSTSHCLVSIIHVNNEIGTIQDIEKIKEVCSNFGVALHIDGVQALGHIPVEFSNMSNVFYTFSSHKFGASRGSGGIITGSPEKIVPQIVGGGQESGIRGGTENIAAFISTVEALEKSYELMDECCKKMMEYSNYVTDKLKNNVSGIKINSTENGLPGLIHFSLKGINSQIVMTEMAIKGFDISQGSACHAGSLEPSRIVMALGLDRVTALGSMRISMGYRTCFEDVKNMTKTLIAILNNQGE